MTHSTIFKPQRQQLNEGWRRSSAGRRRGAYFDETFGPDSARTVAARIRYADKKVIDQYVITLFSTMSAYYNGAAAAGETFEQIVDGRQAQFDALKARYRNEFEPRLMDPEHWAYNRTLELNNALILAAIVYQGSLDAYQGVFDKVGGSFSDALSIFAEAANQGDSIGFLRRFALSQ